MSADNKTIEQAIAEFNEIAAQKAGRIKSVVLVATFEPKPEDAERGEDGDEMVTITHATAMEMAMAIHGIIRVSPNVKIALMRMAMGGSNMSETSRESFM